MAAKKKSTKKARPTKKATKKAPAKKSKKKTTKKRVKVPTAKDILRQVRAQKGVEDDDFAVFSDQLAHTSPVEEWLPSGVLAIDHLTGGGYPVGRAVEIAAWENVGKSTLIDQSIAMAQSLGHVACLVDSEHARDTKYTKLLGVNLDDLIVARADSVEEVFAAIDRLLAVQEANIELLAKVKKKPPIMLICWDSVAGTQTDAERKGAADDHHVASAAKVIKRNFRKLLPRIAKARAVLIFSNQFYAGIGPFASLNTYGGSAVKYGPSLRIWLSRVATLKNSDQNAVGHVIKAKLKKTRVSIPRPPAEVALLYGAGIHNAWTLFEWGKKNGDPEIDGHRWVTQAGSWSRLHIPPEDEGGEEEMLAFQGTYFGFADQLAARPEVYKRMAEQYRDSKESK